MPNLGKSFVAGLAYSAGNPTNVAMASLNIPKGTLVLDTTNAALYIKTSTTDNSAMTLLTSANTGTFTLPTIASGLLASGSVANDFSASTGTFLTSTGLTTISGPVKGSTQALSGVGAVDVVTVTTKLTTTGSAQALSLANGSDGQIKTILHDVDGGSAVLTPTTKTGFSTITFTNAGDTATLQYATTRGWFILAVNGATVA